MPEQHDQREAEGSGPSLPTIAAPKGGGAIRGIGEKFSTNPVTGTAAMVLPIATTPGRSNFGPSLALSYDSGSGNGAFGFGWHLGLPSITRKTDQGLPTYDDDLDVFVLAGAEDLVPEIGPDGQRHRDETSDPEHVIYRYRPRVDLAHIRIERWARRADGDVHWRTISADNVLTVFGRDLSARIADPDRTDRVFSWMISESRDDRGNAVLYDYVADDATGVEFERPSERHRGPPAGRRFANRYLSAIRYGNRSPLLDGDGRRPRFLDHSPGGAVESAEWMFEVGFDYSEADPARPLDQIATWTTRPDPFSSYRSGFEVRTTRRCRRILMSHHIPDSAAGSGYDGLVCSTDFNYIDVGAGSFADYSFLASARHSGHRRTDNGYVSRSFPAVELGYSVPVIGDVVAVVDPETLTGTPSGVDGSTTTWVDVHGEGIPGALTETTGGAWHFRRNLSAMSDRVVVFGPSETLQLVPDVTLAGGAARLTDLDGDGSVDVVVDDGPMPGLWEHDDRWGWKPFRPFASRPNQGVAGPDRRLVDLDGDGRGDLLIDDGEAFTWLRSLGDEGFEPGGRVARPAASAPDDPIGIDASGSIYLADMCGDGLIDLVRIENGRVSYSPNLGRGRFGPTIVMDDSPWFDTPDLFDRRRLRLADLDGTGTSDLVYLHSNGVRLYFNRSGNGWSAPVEVPVTPAIDDLASVEVVDLLGNGTACLVWSSSLPADRERPMRYVDLMGHKPHLLVEVRNNLGAETRIDYAPSTKFYLQDLATGEPWTTRLPFPVHVVERVETFDRVSRCRFVTRYAYHDGYFDGVEREFRGFAMVEQWDTEDFDADLNHRGDAEPSDNEALGFRVPPTLTRTWFHVGAEASAEGRRAYYREPDVTDAAARAWALTPVLPPGLDPDDHREAVRSLKGSMLHQEVFGLDGSPRQPHPYTVVAQSHAVRLDQARAEGTNPVFFTYPAESITRHYERAPDDPRVEHTMNLVVDDFGNVLSEVGIAYGRTKESPILDVAADHAVQRRMLVTATERTFTNPIDGLAWPGMFRHPQPCESSAFELTGLAAPAGGGRFVLDRWPAIVGAAATIPYHHEPDHVTPQRRLVERDRTLFRPDDLGASAGDDPLTLLPIGLLEPGAVPGQTFRLALTADLVADAFVRDGAPLLADPASVLEGAGGYVAGERLAQDGLFPVADSHGTWWIPSSRVLLSADPAHGAAEEAQFARSHFLLPHRSLDPFGQTSTVAYDDHHMMMVECRDALGNRITVGDRHADGSMDASVVGNDYRVMVPLRISDINRNRVAVAIDALGLVAGTALLGKPEETVGDSLDGFEPDLSDEVRNRHLDAPLADPLEVLGTATSRYLYDVDAYARSVAAAAGAGADSASPTVVASISRVTHAAEPLPGGATETKVLHRFAFADGFGREIQAKAQAEPGPLQAGGPEQPVRWVGSGWTVFNNKGAPVRRFEPFFSPTHTFERDASVGVSSLSFYDPLGRVVAVLHADRTYEKSVFDAWDHTTYDPNDLVAPRHDQTGDPRTDPDVSPVVADYFTGVDLVGWKTWYQRRIDGSLGAAERDNATKAAAHADTPTVVALDPLGRSFVTIRRNRTVCQGHPLDGVESSVASRQTLDIEGNPLVVRDADVEATAADGSTVVDPLGRVIGRSSFSLAGAKLRQETLDAGRRWSLMDVLGKPILSWDDRGHVSRTEYDVLRRPIRQFVIGARPAQPDVEVLVERIVYGEQEPDDVGNRRGRASRHLDQAGLSIIEGFDFKGNPGVSRRRLTSDHRTGPDWSAVDATIPVDAGQRLVEASFRAASLPLLESREYVADCSYDALNRQTAVVQPHLDGTAGATVRYSYNEGGLLSRIELVDGASGGGGAPLAVVGEVRYNARGQRERIDYGNGVRTVSTYDELTFRLSSTTTTRPSTSFPDDSSTPAPSGWPGRFIQNLTYTTDPVGNIVHIDDSAQQAVFFRNKRVDPTADYTYDALYQLVEATGREHLGADAAPPGGADTLWRAPLSWSDNDGTSVGRYTERYVYDVVGNLSELLHRGSDPAHAGWRRVFVHGEPGVIEASTSTTKRRNRLTSCTVKAGNAVETYGYDVHGNLVTAPHLGPGEHNIRWDHRDQLSGLDIAGGGAAFYTYDASGSRIRTVRELSPTVTEERLTFDGVEFFRRRRGAEIVERQTVRVSDGHHRVMHIETLVTDTAGTETGPARVTRYVIADHLESVSVELDEGALVASYQEFTPFGSTSYRAVTLQTEVSSRDEFQGMRRDAESGFHYVGARYYASWLCRWTSVDPPVRSGGGGGAYAFVSNNPVRLRDPDGRDGQEPASSKGFLGHVSDFGSGLWKGGKEAVVGVKDLAVGAYNVSLVGMVVDHDQWEKSNEKLQTTVSAIYNNPGMVVDAMKAPYVEAWNNGRPAAAIGLGVFEVVSLVAGTKGLDKLAKGAKFGKVFGKVGSAGQKLGEVGEFADKVQDVGKVADKVGDLATAANKGGDLAKATEKAGDFAKATEKVDEAANAVKGTNKAAPDIGGVDPASIKPDFIVGPRGTTIPTDPQRLKAMLESGAFKDVSTKPGTSRKFVGVDDGEPIRLRIEKAHLEDPLYTGPKDPLHTVDHMHIERKANKATGAWTEEWKVQYDWPF